MLENSVVKLRGLEQSDIDFLYETENDISLWEVSNTVKPYSKYVLEHYLKNSHLDIFTVKQVRLAVESVNDGSFAGFAELFDYEPVHMRAGIGIVIKESERRKRYAENTLDLIKVYCKDILRLNQIYCNIGADNHISIRLFEKSGFEYSGIKKQWLNTSEGFKDVLFYQYFF